MVVTAIGYLDRYETELLVKLSYTKTTFEY